LKLGVEFDDMHRLLGVPRSREPNGKAPVNPAKMMLGQLVEHLADVATGDPISDPFTLNNAARVTALAAKHRLPALYLFRQFATDWPTAASTA
jgi:hypothetical protein